METLTREQAKLVKENGKEPVRLLDPETKEEYVLLPAHIYAQLQAIVADINPREMYPALQRALRDEGWDVPHMDDYNRYG